MKDKYKGIVFIICAASCFAVMNFFVKLSGDVPVLQKCFFRNIVAVAVASALLLKSKTEKNQIKGNVKDLFLRSACGFAGLICNFYAVSNMNIADATMLNKLAPFFAVVFSVIILKEKAAASEWLFIGIAFCGALFVIKPSFSLSSLTAFIGMLGGIGAGAAYTFVRKLGNNGVNGPFIVFFFSAFSSVALLPFVVFSFHTMSLLQTLYLILAGIFAAGGQFCVTFAYKKAPAKDISVYDYSQVIVAALLGFVFLGEIPDTLSITGYIIIIGVAVIKWKCSRIKS